MTAVINCLSPGERVAFVMSSVMRKTDEEAAKALGIKVSRVQGAAVARAQEDRRLPGAALRARRSAQSVPLPVAHRHRAVQGLHRAAADVGGAPAHAAAAVRSGDQVARRDQDLSDAARAAKCRRSWWRSCDRRYRPARGPRRPPPLRASSPRARRPARVRGAMLDRRCCRGLRGARSCARDSAAPVARDLASCAGDGMPPPPREHANPRLPPYSLQLSALVQAWGAAFAGRDVARPISTPSTAPGLFLGVARLGVCGMLRTPTATFVVEPRATSPTRSTRARTRRREWGRFTAAELEFAPWRWLTIWRRHPQGRLQLRPRRAESSCASADHARTSRSRWRPIAAPASRSTTSSAPRTWSLGVYQGARDSHQPATAACSSPRGLVAEPIGPVGNTVSTRGDPPSRGAKRAALRHRRLRSSTSTSNGDSQLRARRRRRAAMGPVGLVGRVHLRVGHARRGAGAPAARIRAAAAGHVGRGGGDAVAAVDRGERALRLARQPGQAGQTLPRRDRRRRRLRLEGDRALQIVYTHKFHYGPCRRRAGDQATTCSARRPCSARPRPGAQMSQGSYDRERNLIL